MNIPKDRQKYLAVKRITKIIFQNLDPAALKVKKIP